MTIIRWLHVSDFHFGRDKVEIDEISRQIVRYVKGKKDSSFAPHMIFITGDIAFSGQDEQYKKFNSVFLEPVIDMIGDNVFMVPGNHDLNRKNGGTSVRRQLPYDFPQYFDPNEDGFSLRNEMLQTSRFKSFTSNDLTFIEKNHWINSEGGAFYKVLKCDSVRIGVVGVNTAWLCTGKKDGEALDEDERYLTPGYNLLRKALSHIEDTDYRIVLGHHPIDWFFNDRDLREGKESIRELLENYQVIYLHGHTHYGRSQYDGIGRPFLTLGAGACFAARNDRKWVNGFFWSELDTKRNIVAVEPLFRKGEIWEIDTRVGFPKMEGGKGIFYITHAVIPVNTVSGSKIDVKPPEGWIKIDRAFIERQRSEPVSADQMLRFFNGVEPNWAQITKLDKIPHRPIVAEIEAAIKNALDEPETLVLALLGPGGEGKTTILMQTACHLAESDILLRVLWHDDKDANWPAQFFETLPFSDGESWLIVSNWADVVVKYIQKTVESLNRKGRHNIHFLISCRTFDWRAVNAGRIPWGTYQARLVERRISGITLEESRMIVQSWGRYKKDGGLGSLDYLAEDEAARRLWDASRNQTFMFGRPDAKEKDADGSFLGAIMTVRKDGQALRDHVLSLLNQIETISSRGNISLIRGFAFIAYMHSVGLPYLSKDVLARALDASISTVNRMIVELADEALVTETGSRVLTRHQLVASTAIELLPKYAIDPIHDVFIVLLQSALDQHRDGKITRDDMAQWNRLPNDIFDNRHEELGLNLVEALREQEPWNTHWVTTQASLMRKTNKLRDVIDMYHYYCDEVERDRAFYFEWALNEEKVGNLELATFLLGTSLSDWPEKSLDIAWQVPTLGGDAMRLNRSLSAMKRVCEIIYKNKGEEIFRQTATLCQQILQNHLDDVANVNRIFSGVVKAAWEMLDNELVEDLPEWLVDVNDLRFNELEKLCQL